MPCCGQTVTPVNDTTMALKTIPDAIVFEVHGLPKQDLKAIILFYNTINHNPVQLGDQNYEAASLRFVTLLNGKISTGNNPERTFEAKAIFQKRGANPHPGLSRVDWLPLLLMLWKPQSIMQAEVVASQPEIINQPLPQEPPEWQRPIPTARP